MGIAYDTFSSVRSSIPRDALRDSYLMAELKLFFGDTDGVFPSLNNVERRLFPAWVMGIFKSDGGPFPSDGPYHVYSSLHHGGFLVQTDEHSVLRNFIG